MDSTAVLIVVVCGDFGSHGKTNVNSCATFLSDPLDLA